MQKIKTDPVYDCSEMHQCRRCGATRLTCERATQVGESMLELSFTNKMAFDAAAATSNCDLTNSPFGRVGSGGTMHERAAIRTISRDSNTSTETPI